MGRAGDFRHPLASPKLIAVAGGADILPELAGCKSARNWITTPDEVIERMPAARRGAPGEIKSWLILQPGPAALTDGLAAVQSVIENSAAVARM